MVKEDKPTVDDLLNDLNSIYEGSWDAISRRARVLYDYAKKQDQGVIVELGTYLGYGAFSLAYGALAGHNLHVFTVDDYVERTGWAGEKYNETHSKKFYDNWHSIRWEKDINLHHVKLSAEEASKTMRLVGLLFVDISPTIDVLNFWSEPMLRGGIILFRDTLTRSLGYDKQVSNAVNSGSWEELSTPDPYFLCIKKK